MFSFLGKNDYTIKCSKILNKETGLDPLIAQAFIEDFKPIFDEQYNKNNDPVDTLINAGITVLQHILSETVREIKIDSKCRIYDKVAVKINQWSLKKLEENSPLIDAIERNLEPFFKKLIIKFQILVIF